jgi:hypothetical protein
MRRGIIVILLSLACALAQAAPQRGLPQPEAIFEVDHLHGIADWLKANGRDGYIGADVADAMGIARSQGEELLKAVQRGFRSDDVLRIAQLFEGYILFMVQRPDDRVYFYLSTPIGGLQKALVSFPSKSMVLPLERTEAELRFRQEVLYWKDRSAAH